MANKCPETANALAFEATLSFLKLVNCRNVAIGSEPVPEKLRRARMKRGQCAGFTRHVLDLRTDSLNASAASGGTHASPRLHLRRGHIRRLRKGNIWIQQMLVGRPHGFVDKSYRVA